MVNNERLLKEWYSIAGKNSCKSNWREQLWAWNYEVKRLDIDSQ